MREPTYAILAGRRMLDARNAENEARLAGGPYRGVASDTRIEKVANLKLKAEVFRHAAQFLRTWEI
jgi:hypothetical protein